MNAGVSPELVEAAQGYERLAVPAFFEQWTQHVLDGADVDAGSHVIDIACGTGVLSRAALTRVGPSGRVVGVDPAPGMLAVARDLASGVEWAEGTAESLPAPDGSFDAILCQFGLMFFTDREKAAWEMFRVARSEGAVTVAVWDSLERNPASADIVELLDRTIGTAAGDAERIPYALWDAREVARLLEGGGFRETAAKSIEGCAEFPSTRHLVEAELRGWLPLFDINLSEEQIADILLESDQVLAKYVTSDGRARFPIAAHIVTGRKA